MKNSDQTLLGRILCIFTSLFRQPLDAGADVSEDVALPAVTTLIIAEFDFGARGGQLGLGVLCEHDTW